MTDPKAAIATPTIGCTYTGIVTHTDRASTTCLVKLDGITAGEVKCRWAAGVFSTFLGIQTRHIPERTTKVAVLIGNGDNWIIGSLSESIGNNPASGASRTHSGIAQGESVIGLDTTAASKLTGDHALPQSIPSDLLEGELDMMNAKGVGIRLLQNLSRLSAGDLAAVECHLLNDMVRILSETFSHYSCFGDYRIYNDGRLNVEWNGTSYDHEAWGLTSKSASKLTGDINDPFPEEGAYDTIGRNRFSQYVGFVGDFIHGFVTDPINELGKLAEPSNPDARRSGKAHWHIGSDGHVLVQSVSEIALERVVRIPVPHRVRHPDDPTGKKAADMDALNKAYKALWAKYDINKPRSFRETTYQLREYARWLSQYSGYARFHQLAEGTNNDFASGMSEAKTATPDMSGREPGDTGDEEAFPFAYSTIRIMRDGSQVLMDAYGSAIVLSQGNVHVSAGVNLTLESAGDVNIMAGQNLNIRARRNAEISCVRGGLKVKARAWLHMLSEMGSLWLKSDAPDASDPAAATALANYQNDPERFTEGQDPVPVIMTRSIIMESTQGRSRLSGYRGVDVESTGTPREEDPDGSDVRVKSLKGKVLVESDNGVNVVSSGGHIVISSALDILMRMRFLTCVGSMFSFNDWVTFRADALHFARRILANTVSVMGTIRARSQTISVIKEENDIKFNTPVTLGHDSPMYNPPAPLLSDQLEGVGSTEDEPRTVADNLTYLPRKDPSVYLNNLRWDFGDVKYARFADEEGVMRLYESYTQQRLRLIEDLPSTHAEADLSEALVNEPVITGVSTLGNGSSKPWPGNAKAYGIDKEGSQENDLSTPSTLESDKWAPSRKKPMAPTDGIFRYIKLED